MGAIATRDIAVGERVLAEPPLFTLSCQSGPKAEAAADAAATAAVQALSISGRKAFDALHQSHVHGSERTPLRTFRSNSLPLGGTSSATEAGLFPVAARFNHSCELLDWDSLQQSQRVVVCLQVADAVAAVGAMCAAVCACRQAQRSAPVEYSAGLPDAACLPSSEEGRGAADVLHRLGAHASSAPAGSVHALWL